MSSSRQTRKRIQAIRNRPQKVRKPRAAAKETRRDLNTRSQDEQPERALSKSPGPGLSNLVPYNPRLLNRSRILLQLGAWEKLANFDEDDLEHNPASAELQLLAAAGHLQKGGRDSEERARSLINSAIEAGLDRESVARILIGGACNTMGRIAALSNRPDNKVMRHFRSAIAIAVPDVDADLLLQPTATRQLIRLARASGSDALLEKAQRIALSLPADEQPAQAGASDEREAEQIEQSIETRSLSIPLALTVDSQRFRTHLVPNHPESFRIEESTLVYELPESIPAYLVSNETGDFEKPSNFHRIQLKPNTTYELRGHIPIHGEQSPTFWFFEYANGKRSASVSFPTKDGALNARVRTGANLESVNFGIRLGGWGRLLVSGLELSLKTASSERKFPINADGKQYVMMLPDWETDYIQRMLADYATPYEPEMLQAMKGILNENDLVLDVGANIGNHSLYLGHIVGCRVIAFEPNPQLSSPLHDSIATNELEGRVTLIEKGVGAAEAKGIFLNLKPNNLGAQSLTLIDGADAHHEDALNVIPLDSMAFDQPVRAIKIDVEGMELDVLKGAKKLLEKDRPDLFIESQEKEQFVTIHAFLEELGYVYWRTFNATPTNWFTPAESAARANLQQHGLDQGKTLYKLWEERQRLRTELKKGDKRWKVCFYLVHAYGVIRFVRRGRL